MDQQESAEPALPSRIVRPYDESRSVRMLTSIEDIIAFDRELREVTAKLPKPIRIGSVLRSGESAYPQWGIQVTDENRAGLAQIAANHYMMDAEENRSRGGAKDDLKHVKKTLASYDLESMATYISMVIKQAAMAIDDGERTFRICNVASGSGRLCSAIATAMREDADSEGILERTEFHLVDYSAKISQAERNLEGFGAKITPHAMLDDQFFNGPHGGFDFIVALGHLHRKPFLGAYLAKLRDALSDGGLLVSGDFHSMMCQNPASVYSLLSDMGLEGWRLNRFDEMLGPLCIGRPESVNEGEREAVDEHIRYWQKLAQDVSRNYQGAQRVRIMGAFTSTAQLNDALNAAGFCTDYAQIRRAFQGARLPSRFPIRVDDKSDNAAVSVAVRLAKGGRP